MVILAATNNLGKLSELREYLREYEIISLKDIGITVDFVEDGNTFMENAVKKALTVARLCNFPVLSDDSGLEVNALNGAPGIYSARYGGQGLDDAQRVKLLLEELGDNEDRRANFTCALALANFKGGTLKTLGKCLGTINYEPKGEDGFGYDPIFVPDGYKETFAQLSIKHTISHRFNAIQEMKKLLYEH